MLELAGSILQVLGKTLEVWDWHNQTKYSRRYKEMLEIIVEEESKPVYGTMPHYEKRDQNKIDKAELQIKILMDKFLKEDGR